MYLPAVKEAWKVLSVMTSIGLTPRKHMVVVRLICSDLFEGLPRDDFIIQTKWYVVLDDKTNVLSPPLAPTLMLTESLKRIRLDYVDVYLVHGNIHVSSIAQGLAE